jgi:uncharacterized protein YaiE (UPF0345 family)
MADWGLYSALRGTDDWAQKRQDQQMNLLAAEKSEVREQKKVAESAAAEADIAKYMEELQNLKVLPEDQERVAAAEKQARQNIVAGIAKNNGDLRRYMSTGGITALNEYKTSVMQSEEVKQAGVNKVNLTNYLNQDAKGNQRHKFVDVEVPMFDKEGNQIGSETKKMSFQDQYDLYKQGKIKQLNYDGSETRINMGIEDFNRMYKNPADPYQEDNYVTASNIYEKMLSKGASEEYAREQANRYADMYAKDGDAWRWKAGDQNELALKMAKLKMARDKAAAKAAGAGGRNTTATRTSNVIGEVNELRAGSVLPSGRNDQNAILYNLGFNKNDDGVYMPPSTGFEVRDAMNPEFKYDLKYIDDIEYKDYVALEDENGITQKYLRATTKWPDPTSLMGGVFSWSDWEDQPFSDVLGYTTPKDSSIEKNWQMDSDNNYFTGDILIPIDKAINTPHIKMQMNKMIGVNENADYTFGSTTNEDMQEMSREYLMYLSEAMGVSPEEVLETFMIANQQNQ